MSAYRSRLRPTKTCAPCRPVRPKNVEAKALSRGPEADPRVLARLDEQEREPEQERQRQAGDQAGAVVPLDRLERPVHREARGHEDDRVHERQVDRQLVPLGRPGPPPPTTTRVEEVDAEEGAEQHRLRRDEEVHAEQARVDARAPVRLGRMLAVRVACAWATAPSAADLRPDGSTTTCRTGRVAPLSIRPTTFAAEPAGARLRERRDDDLVDRLVVHRVERRGDRVGVADVPGRLDSLPLQLGERLRRAGRCTPGWSAARPG